MTDEEIVAAPPFQGTDDDWHGAPCAAYPGVPIGPDLGERKGYSGSGTGLNQCPPVGVPSRKSLLRSHRTAEMLRPVDQRISLTEIRLTDKRSFLEYLNDSDIHRYTCRLPYPYTDDLFQQWIDTVNTATDQYGEPIHWAIRDNDGKLVGGIGFDNLIKGHRAEIGYWLARPYWGQGIMSSVVGAACTAAKSEWSLVRITALVFLDNSASIRVLDKNGFTCEARLKKYFNRDGCFSDALLFAKVT